MPFPGLSGRGIGMCHPAGVVISLFGYPGWLRATPGYANGIPPGCTVTEIRGTPKSGCGFDSQDAGGKSVMSRDCPELARGAGGGGRGVKAPEGWRTPRPGGTRPRLGGDEYHWGVRRGESAANSGLAGTWRMPGSGCEFSSQDAGDELVRAQECPELARGAGGGGRGVKAPEGWRTPRPGGTRSHLGGDEYHWGVRRGGSAANSGLAGTWRMPGSGCEFSSQDAGDELVRAQECPELARGAGGGGRGVKAPEGWRTSRPGGTRPRLGGDEYHWGVRRGESAANSGLARTRRMPGLGWGFTWQDAGDELVRAQECPELARGAGGGGRGVKAPEGWRTPRPGGTRPRLGGDEYHWGVRRGGSAANSGLARTRRMPGSGCEFSSQDAGDELVMSRDCPELARGAGGGGRGVKAPEGWRTPRPGGTRSHLGGDEYHWGVRRGGSAANSGLAGTWRMPGSGWDFSSQDAGDELVRAQECPELARGAGGGGRGVKAPEGWRTSRPGGTRPRLGGDEYHWGVRRGGSAANGGLARTWRMPGSGCEFSSQDAGDELVRAQECPELARGAGGGGRGVKAPEGWRTPRPGGTRSHLGGDEYHWGVRRGGSAANSGLAGTWRMPGSGCEFSSQDAGDELVRAQECPELARGAGGGGREVKAPEGWCTSRPGGTRPRLGGDEYHWGVRRGGSAANSGLARTRRMPGLGWGFTWQDAGGESVMSRDCPEFGWGKAKG